jgi:hypothetical protein
MLEAKVVATLTVRYFNLEASFHENGPTIGGWRGKSYQELTTTASTKNGLPVRVRLTAK